MKLILLRATLALVIGTAGTGSASIPPLAPPTSDTAWNWPTVGMHQLLRGFAAPGSRYGAGHRGIDIRSTGELLAPAEGIVHFAGVVFGRPVLSIAHADGTLSSYEPVTATVVRGEAVRRGQPVAVVEPGHCAQLCVHVGARQGGQYLSPLNFLGVIPRSVLLPTRYYPQ